MFRRRYGYSSGSGGGNAICHLCFRGGSAGRLPCPILARLRRWHLPTGSLCGRTCGITARRASGL
ncbi:MAG TPA: hypothetical protein VN176_08300 [Verrucomicrobiae bacterium]|nr:hypothetical protein [Verrucomicrobiae bacterium]